MTNIIWSKTEYFEEHGTIKGFYDQFPNTPTSLEVGEVYVAHPGTWHEELVKIVHIHDNVALGENISGLAVGRKALYYATGDSVGWKYQDGRATYRLQNRKEN